jgi:hypothetical protein
MPGRACRAATRGSGVARRAISCSSRAIGVARVSSSAQQSSTTWVGTAGSGSAASQARPGVVHSEAGSAMPRSARMAWTRFFSAVEGAHQAGPVAQQGAQVADRLRRDPGLGQQVGAQQLRQGARVDLVVGEPGRGDLLAAAGVDQVRLEVEVVEQVDQPAPAVGGLEGDRGARGQGAQDRDELGRVVGDVAVVLLGAGVVQDGDLGALAMDVHADVHTHQGLLPELVMHPKAYGCRAEQGMGPDPHSIRSK